MEKDFLGLERKESESSEMERDFLGMKGKDSGRSGREEMVRNFWGLKRKESESSVSRQDSVFGGNQSMQPPFSNQLSALQQFMSYKVGQEERAGKLAFDQLASSGFHPVTTNEVFEATRKGSPVQAQQNTFTPDQQGVHQFPMHAYQSHSNTSSRIPMHSLKEAKSPSMAAHNSMSVKTHGAPISPSVTVANFKQPPMGCGITGSTVGAFTQSNLLKPPPTTAQLTIFYGGSVCVYDNVSSNQAQAIMSLANKGSNESSIASTPRPGMPVHRLSKEKDPDGLGINQTHIESVTHNRTSTLTNQTQNLVSSGMPKDVSATLTNETQTPKLVPSPHPGIKLVPSPHRGIPSGVSPTSHTISQARSGSSAMTDLVGAKVNVTLSTNNKNDPPKPTTIATAPVSASPGARKASLARFLEKRKESYSMVVNEGCLANLVVAAKCGRSLAKGSKCRSLIVPMT